MPHKVKVPENLVGELHLPNTLYPLTSSQMATLDDNTFNSADIQLAISKGLLICMDEPIAKIAVKSPVRDKQEKNVVQDKQQVVPEQVAPEQDVPEQALPPEPKTQMGAWDPYKQTILDKDQSSKQTMQNMNATQARVQVGNIDFSDKPMVEEKTITKKIVKKTTRKTSKKDKTLAKAAKEVAKVAASERKKINPVGTKRPEPTDSGADFVYANETSDISFVDQEQEQERIAQHPKLKAKLNEEVQ